MRDWKFRWTLTAAIVTALSVTAIGPTPAIDATSAPIIRASATPSVDAETGFVTISTTGRFAGTPVVQWYNPGESSWENHRRMARSGSTWSTQFTGVPTGLQVYRVIARQGNRATGVSKRLLVRSYAWFDSSGTKREFGEVVLPANTYAGSETLEVATAAQGCVALNLGLTGYGHGMDAIGVVATINSKIAPPTVVTWAAPATYHVAIDVPVQGNVVISTAATPSGYSSDPSRRPFYEFDLGLQMKCLKRPNGLR